MKIDLHIKRECECGKELESVGMQFSDCRNDEDYPLEEGEIGQVWYEFECPYCKTEFSSFGHYYDGETYVETLQQITYPDPFESPKLTVHEIEDKKFIHGHCKVASDDLIHAPLDSTNETTLCGQPVVLVARGLLNTTCLKCREIWHGKNPVEVE